MLAKIKDRLRFYWDSFGPLGRVLGAVYAAVGALTLIRDNFMSEEAQRRYATMALVPRLAWWAWVIAFLALVIIAVLEGAYRAYKKRERLGHLTSPTIPVTDEPLIQVRPQLYEACPDVFLEWDLPDEGKKFPGFGMEKQIIVANRSKTHYAYNVVVSPLQLAETLEFEPIDELAPEARKPVIPKLRRASYKPLENFFAYDPNIEAAGPRGFIKANEKGVAEYRFSMPIALTFAAGDVECAVEMHFDYDMWNGGRFVRVGRKSKPTIQKVVTAPSSFSSEWKGLAVRFEKVPNFARADWQCNRRDNATTSEAWRFAGGPEAKECETLCRYAGALLLKSPNVSTTLSERIRAQSDAAWRWLYFLKEAYRASRNRDGFFLEGTDGTIILSETIDEVSSVSARVCMECAALEL